MAKRTPSPVNLSIDRRLLLEAVEVYGAKGGDVRRPERPMPTRSAIVEAGLSVLIAIHRDGWTLHEPRAITGQLQELQNQSFEYVMMLWADTLRKNDWAESNITEYIEAVTENHRKRCAAFEAAGAEPEE